MSSLVPPLSVPEDQLTRWHPRFNVDTVPAVWASPLPVVLHTAKLSTAQEVLDRARSSITPKVLCGLGLGHMFRNEVVAQDDEADVIPLQMQKALVGLTMKTDVTDADKVDQTSPQTPPVPTPAAPQVQVPVSLKGVSQSLLERVGTPVRNTV